MKSSRQLLTVMATSTSEIQEGDTMKELRKKENECNKCNFTSEHSSTLTAHLETHTGEKMYRCNQCHFSSVWASNLRAHLKIHAGDNPFACITCDAIFFTSGELKQHCKIHSSDKAFACTLCSAEFARNYYLNRHFFYLILVKKCLHAKNVVIHLPEKMH